MRHTYLLQLGPDEVPDPVLLPFISVAYCQLLLCLDFPFSTCTVTVVFLIYCVQVIDATRYGNLLRFTNHSCSPNCEMQKWNVRGVMRVGLFAIKEIPAGSELCFDYQMEMFDKKPVKARCDECLIYVSFALHDFNLRAT